MWNEFVHTLLEITLTMSAVIVLAGVVGLLTRKRYAPKWRCLVWGIIAVRLLVPVNLSLPEAPVSLSREPLAKTVQVRRYNLPERDPLIPEKVDKPAVQEAPASEVVASTSEVTLPERDFPWLSGQPLTAEKIFFGLWLFGGAALMEFYVLNALRFRRRWRREARAPEKRTRQALEEIRRDTGIKRRVRLFVCGDLPSPMATGLIRPVILLPTEDYTDDELSAIFRHELLHIRRSDLWKKLLFLAAKILHWFNPFVWWMERTANREIELACDAAVVAGAGTEERSAYGEAVLAAMRKGLQRERHTPMLASAFAGGKRTLKERFHVIFDDGKKRSGALALVLILLITALGGSLVACGEVEQTNRELTVFCYDEESYQAMQNAVTRFRSTHLGIEVRFYDIPHYDTRKVGRFDEKDIQNREDGYAQFLKQMPKIYEEIRNDLILGKGPDLILFSQEDKGFGTLFPDVDKAMMAGVFADIGPLLKADESYNVDDINQKVLEAGQYRGKQYVMPLFYTVPLLMADQKALEAEGFDWKTASSVPDFLDEAVRYIENGGTRHVFTESGLIKTLPEYAGLDLLNFKDQTINLDSPEFRRMQEAIKFLINEDREKHSANVQPYEIYGWMEEEWIKRIGSEGNSLFYYSNDFQTLLMTSRGDIFETQEPIITSLRGVNSKVTAKATVGVGINNSSPNQQIAYDFLRLLMGYDFLDSGIVKGTSISDRLISRGTEIGNPDVDSAMGWIKNIGSASFQSDLPDRLEAYFEPYYDDEATYDECLEKAKRELLLYVSE